MRRDILLIIVGVVVGLLLVGAAFWMNPYQMRGSVIQQDYAAPDFALRDAQGQEFRLSDQKGKLVLIFFGYTFCPDVCPATLSDMKQVRQRLGKDADNVRYVFITVDPERDTPERMAGYAAGFDPSFIGLSGTPEELGPVWKDYGVFFQIHKSNPEDSFYLVDHSSQVYLIDKAGNLKATYSFGTPVEDLFMDVRYLLRK